jgi:D-beta-D-heptose 7-phosphate kinase/D-beta-D-heptose 1-phosphate adenosyltransferase
MTGEILKKIVDGFRGKKILVVGDLMLDEYVSGEVHRISPEAPIPVVRVTGRLPTLGGAANTAGNVVQLGGRALLSGVVGRDQEASLLKKICKATGIEIDGFVIDANRPTTTKTRIVADSQQIVRVDRESNETPTRRVEHRIIAWVEEKIEMIDACVLSDYAKGIVTARIAQSLIRLASRSGKPVVVDPKGRDYQKYRGATVIKPNVRELQQLLSRRMCDGSRCGRVTSQLARLLPNTALLVTRGSRGMTLFQRGSAPIPIRAEAHDVYDVTGAGDTVIATLALALAANASLEQGADLANCAAGVVVGKRGTATVTAAELINALASRNEASLNNTESQGATSPLKSQEKVGVLSCAAAR